MGEKHQIIMGQSPKSKNYTNNPNDFILVQGNSDIKNGRVFPRVWTSQVTKHVKKGTIIFSVRAPVGDVAWTDYDVVLGRGVAGIKGNDFLFNLLDKMKSDNYWDRFSTGSTFESINSNDIKNAYISIPMEDEQEKLGSFFLKLDSIITLHQRKLQQLKLLKRAYLQKMFPEKGEIIPKIRFTNFDENWDLCKLSDYLSIPKKEEVKINDPSDLMTLKLNLGGLINGTLRETLSLNATKYYKRYAGQLIYGKQNFFNGSVAIVPSSLDGKATSGDVPSLDIYNINSDFLLTFISRESYWKRAEKYASGTGSKRIHEDTLLNFEIIVPTMEEQKSIQSLFIELDKLVKLNENKINDFKSLKQAYLQKMFI